MVYVLNNDGSPLMPCTEAKARHLVEGGKAKVVRRTPFIIRLTFLVEGEVNTEAVTLGVDAGSSLIGVSVTTEGRVLLEAEVEVRNDVPQNMEERRSKRRARRNRKTRYREARLDNRKRPKGWLTPTMETKVRTHENVIDKLCSILPVSRIVIESASFDIQKIRDPGIEGEEYQQGEQLGYENVKAYVKARDGFRCRSCGSRDHIEVHHIRQRKDGGSNSPDNLVTLCHECHRAWHEGKKDRGTLSEDPGFKAATEMSFDFCASMTAPLSATACHEMGELWLTEDSFPISAVRASYSGSYFASAPAGRLSLTGDAASAVMSILRFPLE